MRGMKVSICERSDVKDFIEKYHYSKNINGVKSDYCFSLNRDGKLIGAMIYGKVAMANVWKKYVKKKDDLIELRRLVCIDDTPKNTESFFIGKTIRYLRQYTKIRKIISYADPEYGHDGTIYKATNFKLLGKTSKGRVILFNGKRYHDKTIRTKYKGKLKPYAKKIKDALERGEAKYKRTTGKYIYLFNLRKRRGKKSRKK